KDLLAGAAEYLIIADQSFIPANGDTAHPLARYIQHRESQGWSIKLVSVQDVQMQYGGGMALPQAVTNYLKAADSAFGFTHVLLIGDDTYDYMDKLGHGSISYIPTMYRETAFIAHSPSDNALLDLDGKLGPDKASGRWPVRTLTDLEVVVTKTLDWEDNLQGPQHARSAVWITDAQDPNNPSFVDQAEKMIAEHKTPEAGGKATPWPAANIDRVYYDQVVAKPGISIGQTAREQFIAHIEDGKTITGYVGHGSTTGWSRWGLLRPGNISDMNNEGKPTLITTLTCYTSYFVSPLMDTLAHRLLNGYRIDAGGAQIAGVANGAVAVHGATTLSSYGTNELVAEEVLKQQMQNEETLGRAVQIASDKAAASGFRDVVVNWALLGDPTLKVTP
ncbi:MAG: hypothetical protein ACI9FD_002753, partial [Gammaproteobacteria bacterium]